MQNIARTFALLGKAPGTELHEDADRVWYLSGLPHLILNGVVEARYEGPDPEAWIDEALAPFRTRQLPMIWITDPTSRPIDLEERLLGRGLERVADSPGMAVELAGVSDDLPPAVEIRRVDGDDVELERAMQLVTDVFEMPAFVGRYFLDLFGALPGELRDQVRNYVALVEGRLVGASSMFMLAGVAGMYNVVTAPDARRLGVGTALTARPLLEARAMGYRAGVLQSSEMGLSVYREIGFRELCRVRWYTETSGSNHPD
ncbi:MAG: GNAT family N-acetyltransferase [Actinomycetota bacterium]|nr:GNAT family N-acetyltransferase [Actinomycetota bacterium]